MGRPQMQRSEFFAAHRELLDQLQPLGVRELRPKGAVLFRQGDSSRGCFLLVDGEAKLVLARDDGREIKIRTVGSGYLLGLPGTILNRAYLFTAKLTRDSLVVFVPADEMINFLRQRNDLCFDIVEMLGGELLDLPAANQKRVTRSRGSRHNA